MGLSKKGFFFTLLSLMILSIFMVIFTWEPSELSDTTLYSQKAQAKILTAFTRDLKEVFMRRVIWTSSHRAIESLLAYVEHNNSIDDVSLRIEELLLNGTLYNHPAPLMYNETLFNWSDQIIDLAWRYFKIETEITYYGVDIAQFDPWSVIITVDLNIKTNNSGVIYRIGGDISTNFTIIGLQDPLFLNNKINRTILEATPEQWNATTMINQISAQSFRHSNVAPNFISRMENATGTYSDCCGIISLFSGTAKNYSHVDFHYFNKTDFCPAVLFNISKVWNDTSGLGVGFKIDGPHLFKYGYHDDGENATHIIC